MDTQYWSNTIVELIICIPHHVEETEATELKEAAHLSSDDRFFLMNTSISALFAVSLFLFSSTWMGFMNQPHYPITNLAIWSLSRLIASINIRLVHPLYLQLSQMFTTIFRHREICNFIQVMGRFIWLPAVTCRYNFQVCYVSEWERKLAKVTKCYINKTFPHPTTFLPESHQIDFHC